MTALDDIAQLVEHAHEHRMSSGQVLATLRAHGRTPDAQALARALEALERRDDLIAGNGDPGWDMPPGALTHSGLSAREAAIADAEDELHECLLVLGRKRWTAVAS